MADCHAQTNIFRYTGCVGGWDAWMRGRRPAERCFHKTGTNAVWGTQQTAEADDPPGVVMVIPIQSCPVMATSKMPEIPTDISALVPKKTKQVHLLCLAQGYGNSQQVGSCWGRQGRQAPGQDLRTPTLAAYRDQSSALPFKFCCLWDQWDPCPAGLQLAAFLRKIQSATPSSLRRNGSGS